MTATLANGRARLSAGPFNWDADLPAVLGGENLAPSPTAYLLGALAGCAVAFLRDTLAPQFGVEIDDVTAVASAASDLRGLARDRRRRARPRRPGARHPDRRRVARPTGSRRCSTAWRERCPIYLALLEAERDRADDGHRSGAAA